MSYKMSYQRRFRACAGWIPSLVLGAVLSVPALLLAQHARGDDPLPSWRDGQAKLAILDFVRQVTDTSDARYVTPAERIATFDDDGTLWTEWPRHINQVQIVFARQRVQQMTQHHWEWKYQDPFRSILKNRCRKMSDSAHQGR